MNAAVVVDRATKVYPTTRGRASGVTAADAIELTIEPGEVFGMLGPNGAGKTTTIGMCTARIRPTSGRITVVGVDVATQPVRVKRAIGVVSQVNTLDRSCTVYENIYLHCRYFNLRASAARRRTDELLETFRLTDRARALPSTLSGGLAQRVQLARAVAHDDALHGHVGDGHVVLRPDPGVDHHAIDVPGGRLGLEKKGRHGLLVAKIGLQQADRDGEFAAQGLDSLSVGVIVQEQARAAGGKGPGSGLADAP